MCGQFLSVTPDLPNILENKYLQIKYVFETNGQKIAIVWKHEEKKLYLL